MTPGYRDPPTSSARRSAVNHPQTEAVPLRGSAPRLTRESIRRQLRALGITEDVFVHEQDYERFLQEKGLKELGRGGEGSVYFLRGHAVKVVSADSAEAALREAAHMLHLNHLVKGGALGDRSRQDWPSLLWIYALSDGSLSIGMKPFDADESRPGSTLYERLVCGPALDREHGLRALRAIAHSLLYAERQGIIHHDLKPANIFIPGNPEQQPVVFDLGQALWRQSAWGRLWLKHEHNRYYWYNGTFRYMHRLRRLAHQAALASVERRPLARREASAMGRYIPSGYDDVFAYARILRDFTRSPHTYLFKKDKQVLQRVCRRLMGLERPPSLKKTPAREENGLVRRISQLFHNAPAEAPRPKSAAERWNSMEQVLPELERAWAELAVN